MESIESGRNLIAEESKLNEAKQRVDELKTQLAKIDKMTSEEVMSSAFFENINVTGNVLELPARWKAVLAEEASLVQSGAGDNDPRLKTLRSQKAELKEGIDEAAHSIKMNFQSRLEIAQNYLDSKQKVYDTAKENLQNAHIMSVDYVKAKENYLNAKKLLDSLEQRLATESMQLRITNLPAEIWERAEPAKYPSVPHMMLILPARFRP